MSNLEIDFSLLGDAISDLNSIDNKLDSRKTDYSGIRDRLNNMSDSSGNVSFAVSEINSKISEIDDKIDDVRQLKGEIQTFKSNAKSAESRVANRISADTESFAYSMGIDLPKPEKEKKWYEKLADAVVNTIEDVGRKIGDGIDAVVDWYEENKDVIWAVAKVIVDVVVCVTAIVAFVALLPASGFLAICSAVIAGWTVLSTFGDAMASGLSLGFYLAGDKANGDKWSKLGFKDEFIGLGEMVGLKDAFTAVYYTMTVASVAQGAYNFGKGAIKAARNVKWSSLTKSNLFSDEMGLKNFAKKLIGIPSKANDRSNLDTFIHYAINLKWDANMAVSFTKFKNVVTITDMVFDSTYNFAVKDKSFVDSLTSKLAVRTKLEKVFTTGVSIFDELK